MSPQPGFEPSPRMTPRRHGPQHSSAPAHNRYTPPAAETVRTMTAIDLLQGARPVTGDARQLTLLDSGLGRTLWCTGDPGLLQQRCVAIIGTRDMSAEGAARARRLARELSTAKVVVVSGLAKGIDTEALSAAITAGGRVVAVIGTPLDRVYPKENSELQETVYRQHLLVSPFAPSSRVFKSNFPDRNRLMALLTDASVIVEAGETSGTLHQAAECVRLGRWLFIAKNVMDDPTLKWPATFRGYSNVRTLTETGDLLTVLSPRVES